MRKRRAWTHVTIAGVALALLIALPPAARARKLQMSGTWAVRNGIFFIPLQFVQSLGGGTITSMGDLSKAAGHPNGPIPGGGHVTVTGSDPATLRVPAHRFVDDAMALVHIATTLDRVTTSVGIDAPYATATLAPGDGPGSFTWCPGDTACAAAGGMRATDPPQGAGARNGRVIYRAGAHRFGGAMQLGLRGGGDQVIFFVTVGWQFLHIPWVGYGSTLRKVAFGGLGSADLPSVQTVFLPRAHLTQPTMTHSRDQSTFYPGPKMTTMLGLTTTATGPLYYVPPDPIATGPMGTLAGVFTTHYGFGHTTGTVIVQQTAGTAFDDFFTVMGSDMRTALGAGNISTVAGGISFRNSLAGETPFATFHKVWMTLAAPTPSLSPAGIAAAAALLLLTVAWARWGRG